MSEYKRWKHAAWALVFMAACARDPGDDFANDEPEHARDDDEETEEDAARADLIGRSRKGAPDPVASGSRSFGS